jgi:hypothetical protein
MNVTEGWVALLMEWVKLDALLLGIVEAVPELPVRQRLHKGTQISAPINQQLGGSFVWGSQQGTQGLGLTDTACSFC